jgi:hypothetical protein
MNLQSPHHRSSWPRHDEDEDWVPLYQAPVVYRTRLGDEMTSARRSAVVSRLNTPEEF